ncbi:MAG: DUF3291 domain-containing protein [Micropruina sp.]|uniref:DUF3291 domain-containing protein n=1 Tax=Micropruina sp. TaxID=2737536 RepID=UPI0039E52DEB
MADPLLAVVTAAVLKYPLGDPRLAGFLDGVDRVNRLAEASPGFVWRHHGVVGHAALIEAFGHPDVLLNLSLWASYPDLHAFTYRGLHGRYLSARERWFVPLPGPTTALWWLDGDVRPDPDAALARLLQLRRHGPSARAFSVLRRWRPDGTPEPPARRRRPAR